MRRAAALVFGVLLFLTGCASSGEAGTADTPQAPSTVGAEDSAPEPNPEPDETAGDALKRQLQFLSDGQTSRVYDELHPEQQKLFTLDQYRCARDKKSGVDIVGVEIIDEYPERIPIPGTSLQADSTAVTAKITVTLLGEEQSDTDTFHEIAVDGKWKFTVSDPSESIDCVS